MKFSKLEKTIVTNLWVNDTKAVVDALSKMTRKDIKIIKCSFKKVRANRVPIFLNPKELSFFLSYNKITGAINGVVAIACSLEDILKLADILIHKKIGYYTALSEENLPVIRELTNILQGYYLTSLLNIFGTEINWEGPFISTNAYRAVEDFDFGPIYIEKIYVFMFYAKLLFKDEKIKFQALLFFKDVDIRQLLDKIAQKIQKPQLFD